MTRGKWVALAVGLAVIAVLVPYGPAVWRVVAYVEERKEVIGVRDIFEGRPLPPDRKPLDFVIVTRKRLSWLPGADATMRCRHCAESEHPWCPRWVVVRRRNVGSGHPESWAGDRYNCDCPHPSHAQDSE